MFAEDPRELDLGGDLVVVAAGVENLEAGPKPAVVSFRDNSFADPAGLVAFIQEDVGRTKLRPDHRMVYRRDWHDAQTRKEIQDQFDDLEE